MADPVLKISDVKSLKELAHVLTYPLIAVAYFLQSGPSIGWDKYGHWGIPESASLSIQLIVFFLYFILKSIWICSGVAFLDVLSRQIENDAIDMAFLLGSVVFIGFGLMGLFAPTTFVLLEGINKFWFMACLVWGFACLNRIGSGRGN